MSILTIKKENTLLNLSQLEAIKNIILTEKRGFKEALLSVVPDFDVISNNKQNKKNAKRQLFDTFPNEAETIKLVISERKLLKKKAKENDNKP